MTSVLLFTLFHDYLLEQGTKEENIIEIALDQRRNYQYRNSIKLCEHIEKIICSHKDEKYYLFIDEVQMASRIKSALRIDDEEKMSSELASLMLTKDFFKKVIIRFDILYSFYDDNGIFHCSLVDFLLDRVNIF